MELLENRTSPLILHYICSLGDQKPLEESHRDTRAQHDPSTAGGHRRDRGRYRQRQRRTSLRLHPEEGNREGYPRNRQATQNRI